MAKLPLKNPRAKNVEGNLFIDQSCIDCGVCEWMCPSVFARKSLFTLVHKQPETEQEKMAAYGAMVSCPVGAINTHAPDPLAKQALDLFPALINSEQLPNLFHLGFHAEESFGAIPYFLKRKDGNIMIDTPRYNSKLAKAIELEGGLKYIILTHRDDIADHEKWKKHFPNAARIIHRVDVTVGSKNCEIKLFGAQYWRPGEDITIIHTPGHTAGHICIQAQLKNNATVLFSGDHLTFTAGQGLHGFKFYNRGNLENQYESMLYLATDEFPFTWILPAHGRIARFETVRDKNGAILEAAEKFRTEDDYRGMFDLRF